MRFPVQAAPHDSWDTADVDHGVARVNRATCARAIGVYFTVQILVNHLYALVKTEQLSEPTQGLTNAGRGSHEELEPEPEFDHGGTK